MAYNQKLADRTESYLQTQKGFSQRKMFGGICFMINGHMTAGVVDDKLMLRVGPDQYQSSLKKPHAFQMDFTGKPMKGMIYVDPKGTKSDTLLKDWLKIALNFTQTLTPKANKSKS